MRAGSRWARRAARFRFSQWPTMSLNRAAAQATPPSRKAKFMVGKRRVTPPRKSDLASALLALGQHRQVVGHVARRRPVGVMPMNPEWKAMDTPRSRPVAHTGS